MTAHQEAQSFIERGLSYQHLFTLKAELGTSLDGGDGPLGRRTLNAAASGTFEGPRIKGQVNPGTGDWMLTRRDGVNVIDARLVLLTDDDAIIHMSYGGRAVVAPDLIAEVRNPEKRHLVDPSRYYFRTTPTFETGSAKYNWLNNVVCVGSGRLLRGRGLAYEVFEIL